MTTLDEETISRRARQLAATIEPVAGQAYFSPECHAAYESLGFGPSSAQVDGVAMPDGMAYFTSRGSLLGQVPGEVVAAAFGVFNPEVVITLVTHGWTVTDASTIGQARTDGAIGQLTRILGAEPTGVERARELLAQAGEPLRVEGKPLYAGVRAQSIPDQPLGAVWRLADRLREFRGDVHIASWTCAGFTGVEIGLLSELYWGLPLRTYIRSRAWSNDELDAGVASLEERGFLSDGAFTDEGRAARESVELETDRGCQGMIEALGDGFEELIGIMRPWGDAIRSAGGYPGSPRQIRPRANPGNT